MPIAAVAEAALNNAEVAAAIDIGKPDKQIYTVHTRMKFQEGRLFGKPETLAR